MQEVEKYQKKIEEINMEIEKMEFSTTRYKDNERSLNIAFAISAVFLVLYSYYSFTKTGSEVTEPFMKFTNDFIIPIVVSIILLKGVSFIQFRYNPIRNLLYTVLSYLFLIGVFILIVGYNAYITDVLKATVIPLLIANIALISNFFDQEKTKFNENIDKLNELKELQKQEKEYLDYFLKLKQAGK